MDTSRTATGRLLVCAGVALFAAARLDAQSGRSTLSVGVAEAQTGAPIPSAEVLLPELRMLGRTDSLGQMRIAGIPYGVHRVRVRRIGFAPSDIQLRFASDTTGAVFRLERSAVTLTAVDVSADAVPQQLRDFETRRTQGFGRFLTEADLMRDADRSFMTMATTRFPGLRLAGDADNRRAHLSSVRPCGAGTTGGGVANRGFDRLSGGKGRPRGPAGATAGGGASEGGAEPIGACIDQPCPVQIYLDGVNLGQDDDDLIRTWDLSGVEFYSGASMPARYRTSGSACGVMLLWSKWR